MFLGNTLLLNLGQTDRQVVARGRNCKLNLRRDLGDQTDSKVFSQVHASRKKGVLSSILLAKNSLMDVTRLKLTWLDGQTVKTCFDLRANVISTKLSASQRKYTCGDLERIAHTVSSSLDFILLPSDPC